MVKKGANKRHKTVVSASNNEERYNSNFTSDIESILEDATEVDPSTSYMEKAKKNVKDTMFENFREMFVELREDIIKSTEDDEFNSPAYNLLHSRVNSNKSFLATKKGNNLLKERKKVETIKIEENRTPMDGFKSYNDFEDDIFQGSFDGRSYRCPVPECKKVFPTLGRMKRHYIIHTDIKPFRCKSAGCTRRFSRKDNMLQHYRCHCEKRKNEK